MSRIYGVREAAQKWGRLKNYIDVLIFQSGVWNTLE